MSSFVGKFLRENGLAQKFLKDGEHVPPIARGIGPTLLPKPVKFYISFGKPVDTMRFKNKFEDEKVLWQLRTEVELAMYKQLEELMKIRDKEAEEMPLWRKVLTKL